MAARVSMAALISQVRTLIGDPSGVSQALTDDEIQAVMDTHRQEARYLALKGLLDYEAGSPVYKVWQVPTERVQAPQGQWESSAALVDTQYQALTPSSADYVTGRWTFGTSQTGVLLTGWCYDLYGAAADLLEAWAGKAAGDYDFTADGATFHRSQKAEGLRKLAAEYRKKAWVRSVLQVRGDLSNAD